MNRTTESIDDINLAAESGELTILDFYNKVVARRGYISDESQMAAVAPAGALTSGWAEERRSSSSSACSSSRAAARRHQWGGVGRAKP